MQLCSGSSAFDFWDGCVRSSWSAILPFLVAITFCVASLRVPWPSALQKSLTALKAPFRTFITLHEAEAVDLQSAGEMAVDSGIRVPQATPFGRSLVFTFAGVLQSLAWIASGVFYFVAANQADAWHFAQFLLIAFSWLYTAVRPVASPFATAPYDLFVVYLLHLVGGVLLLGGRLFDYAVGETPLPSTPTLVGLSANLVTILVLLYFTVIMPMDLPSTRVKKEDIGDSVSPEDYTRLWGWITFNWVYPLIKRGTHQTLNEKDVWGLSPTMQSGPVFIKFQSIRGVSLLRRLIVATSLDMILDFVGTVLTIFFDYAGPFFLKRILDSVNEANPSAREKGTTYIYAGLMFLCSVLKAQCDLQHRWFSRRACTHVRSELMAAIYDKTLKRKDFSGIVSKDSDKAVEAKKSADSADTTKVVTKADKAKAKVEKDKANDPRAGADTGKIQNLMSSDADDVASIAADLFFVFGAPFELAIGSFFLYQLLGWSAFAGFAVFFACWPLNTYLTNRGFMIHKGRAKAKDKRLAVLDELIGSIKFIKFFAWEERWIDRAMAAREEEMRWMLKANINSVVISGLWRFAPISLSLVSFFTYVWLGNELTVGTAFTAITLFSMIRSPLNTVPTYIVHIIQARVALKRIAVYLDEDEVTAQVSSLKQDLSAFSSAPDEGLGLENASFEWNKINHEKAGAEPSKVPESHLHSESSISVDVSTIVDASSGETPDHRFELKDLSIRFPENHLSVITGPTASGKTALLMALMGEMTLLPGGRIIMAKNNIVDEHGNIHGIAYAAQSPWLRHQSIRDNILFGSPMDETRYNDVIQCCALKPDLEMLEDGDASEIGVKGVSLSGGQKARVALARAIYSRKKYVLLDDPLSAVDSNTSRFLYEKCLQGPLLANRTVILVTHHIELVLPGAHYVVRMLDGRIDTQGTVEELRAKGVLDEIAHEAVVEVQKEEPVVAAEAPEALERTQAKKPRKLVEDEHRETGRVKWSVYRAYLSASSYYIWSFLAFLIVAQQLRAVSEKIWIKIWTEAYTTSFAVLIFKPFGSGGDEILLTDNPPYTDVYFKQSDASAMESRFPSASERPMFYVGVYAVLGMAGVILQLISAALQYTGALRASRILFKRLLVTVVRATFRFHDTTPQGRMLNRFSKDFATIDGRLAGSLQAVNSSLAGFFASILTVTVVFPPFLLPASIIGYLYRYLAIGYLNTGRDLRRLESNTRSPIFSDFGELLTGIVTVRAFSAEKRFMDSLHSRIDETSKYWYATWMTNRWLLVNFDLLGSISVFITALFAITFLHDDAGLAGLAITSALTFSESVYWACRFWTGLELDLNSVERIIEYTDLPQEPPAIIESQRPPAYWPSSATNASLVVVEALTVKYAPDLPSVLQDVSFELKAGERVGLVGRTGSGKSTLAMSLLRFVDPSSGRILIDGIDISKIGIHDLRSRVTFIPQDATLFSGSLRDNLDPFGDHEDSACLDVLLRVNLIKQSDIDSQTTSRVESVAASPLGSRAASVHGDDASDSLSALTNVETRTKLSLDTQVSAGGTNFSQGQKQLIAMARALLRRSSIVVMDEATSSVDFETDSKIQATIRTEFTNSLLITVAHRLRTIIDYDRLLVLDKGKVVEFDTPSRLIQKEDGIFRNMCLKSGSFGELEAAAKAKDAVL